MSAPEPARRWRILHVLHSMDPVWGGPPMIAIRLAGAQAAAGHQVSVLTYEDPARHELIRQAHARVPGVDRLDVRTLPPASRTELLWGRRLGRRLDEMLAGHDVVHLHGIWPTVYRVAGLRCRRAGKPYAMLVNGMLDPWSLGQKALKKKLAWWLAYGRMVKGAAFLHLGNEEERRGLAPLGLSVPTAIIPNGICREEFEPLPPPGSFLASQPRLQGRPYVLFMSRLHLKKGLVFLAEAFARIAARFPDVQLVVAGPDDGEKETFERRVAECGIGGRVHLVGPLYGRDKYAALVDALCFCLPSHQEGFSVAILEALGCGVPAVLSQGCHFPEVAEAGAGVVVPLSAEAVAGALARVLEDDALRREMGRRARELVDGHYLWSGVARQTVEAYARFARPAAPVFRGGAACS